MRVADTHTITPAGELDLATAAQLGQELQRVENTNAAAIVLDLSQLKFIDTTGLRLTLQADARSRADSHRLSIVRPPERVFRAFEICGLATRLPWR